MVNVIIPAYNCSATIGRTLGSLVAQTDTDFKVIIVDDCSIENIKPIVDDYSNKLDITYIRNEYNVGCGMSRQVGIDNLTSKFFCFLDSDDMFMPYTIEIFNSIIDDNPNVEFVHGHFYKQISVHGKPALDVIQYGFTWCHGKLYNRDAINKYGIRNSPKLKWADDSYFNSMCSELLQQYFVHAPLYLWCDNEDSVTRCKNPDREKNSRKDFLLAMKMSTDFILKYKDDVGHLKETISKLLRDYKSEMDNEELKLLNELKKYVKE